MSSLPSRFETNAMVSPSGEADGCELSDGSCVSWIASELVIGCMKIWRCPVRGEWNTTARPSAGQRGGPSVPPPGRPGGGPFPQPNRTTSEYHTPFIPSHVIFL